MRWGEDAAQRRIRQRYIDRRGRTRAAAADNDGEQSVLRMLDMARGMINGCGGAENESRLDVDGKLRAAASESTGTGSCGKEGIL